MGDKLSYKDALESVDKTNTEEPEDIKKSESNSEKKYKDLKNKHLNQVIQLQQLWSRYIGRSFLWSIVVVWIFIFFLGWRLINYQDYIWFPHSVIGAFFAQVIGLAIVVVKYLFPTSKE